MLIGQGKVKEIKLDQPIIARYFRITIRKAPCSLLRFSAYGSPHLSLETLSTMDADEVKQLLARMQKVIFNIVVEYICAIVSSTV